MYALLFFFYQLTANLSTKKVKKKHIKKKQILYEGELKLKKAQGKPKNIILDLALLKSNQAFREKYHVAVQNKFEALGEVEEEDPTIDKIQSSGDRSSKWN